MASVLHALSHTFTLASYKRSQLPGCKVPDGEVCMVKTKQNKQNKTKQSSIASKELRP